ncbi:MAG: hypothetical protein L0154_25160 [Chloroflexi bacterium]|nr:hypothetical protein [Chloroflexota bacterium]
MRTTGLILIIILVASGFVLPSGTAFSGENCQFPSDFNSRIDEEGDLNPHCTSHGNPLIVTGVCNGPDLEVTIVDGDGPFNITATAGQNMPVNGVSTGTTTIIGPEKWDGVTVTETTGNTEAFIMGTFKCRTNERAVPLLPAHQARLTTPNPLFSWTSITNASRYRVMVFDDKVAATRTVDIRQNTSGAETQLTLTQSLSVGRYFWRVRGRQNRVWSLWSIRFTLFIDPVSAFTVSTPVPFIDGMQPPPTVAAPTIVPGSDGSAPPDRLPQEPTALPAPPNSRE